MQLFTWTECNGTALISTYIHVQRTLSWSNGRAISFSALIYSRPYSRGLTIATLSSASDNSSHHMYNTLLWHTTHKHLCVFATRISSARIKQNFEFFFIFGQSWFFYLWNIYGEIIANMIRKIALRDGLLPKTDKNRIRDRGNLPNHHRQTTSKDNNIQPRFAFYYLLLNVAISFYL